MSAAMEVAAVDADKLPINVLNTNLTQAHAIVDLLVTLCRDCDPEHVESLCPNTLGEALSLVLVQIDEAKDAADKLSAERAS